VEDEDGGVCAREESLRSIIRGWSRASFRAPTDGRGEFSTLTLTFAEEAGRGKEVKKECVQVPKREKRETSNEWNGGWDGLEGINESSS
jgi:hypothetical protein